MPRDASAGARAHLRHRCGMVSTARWKCAECNRTKRTRTTYAPAAIALFRRELAIWCAYRATPPTCVVTGTKAAGNAEPQPGLARRRFRELPPARQQRRRHRSESLESGVAHHRLHQETPRLRGANAAPCRGLRLRTDSRMLGCVEPSLRTPPAPDCAKQPHRVRHVDNASCER